MTHTTESKELASYFLGDSPQDLLRSYPIIVSQIESTTVLAVLEGYAKQFLSVVENELACKISLVAFGSLGRLEFAHGESDLDPIILLDPVAADPDHDLVRLKILTPLFMANPWLPAEDRQKIVAGDWEHVDNKDRRYPVITRADLTSDAEGSSIRRIQLLLEARPIYNAELFREVYADVLKKVTHIDPSTGHISIKKLAASVREFYASFENPEFLFKSATKFWKTRILREYYEFSTNLLLVLGYYLQVQGDAIPIDYFRCPAALKIVRAMAFAERMEKEFLFNHALETRYSDVLDDILKDCKIDSGEILLYGAHYSTNSARIMHGLLFGTLSRFVGCWQRLHYPHVQKALSNITKDKANFDARFRKTISDTEAAAIVEELVGFREAYLRHMSAVSLAVEEVFRKGTVWSAKPDPDWITENLEPFFKYEV